MFQTKFARRSETAIGDRLHTAPAQVLRAKCASDLESDAKFAQMTSVLVWAEITVERIKQEVAVAKLVSCSEGNP